MHAKAKISFTHDELEFVAVSFADTLELAERLDLPVSPMLETLAGKFLAAHAVVCAHATDDEKAEASAAAAMFGLGIELDTESANV